MRDLIERVLLEYETVIAEIINRPVPQRERAGAGIGVLAIDGALPSERP
ncbi:hypothetical protein EV668_2220 [Enterovirga rhinocerotis]|uniref:Uncharacterized protein n=2 Tax=Enterovirga rhinocerotis TaxID=1339210 RepID=A0A4R7C917_9HYPH|nr:hypothetical protein EV668_2220 [Enterovirga rhinocerotis]